MNRNPLQAPGRKYDEIIQVNPFRCRMWKFHDRLEEYLTDESCKAEILSMEHHGQVVPALGRLVFGDPSCDVELIYGARRLFVARHLNQPITVRVRDMSDFEALVAMEIENRQRKDISPYERGLSYARWLRAGLFKSQEELAKAMQISPATVSRLLRIARLPSVVLNAFRSPLEIAEDWGLQLADAWDDPTRRPALVRRARALAAIQPRPPARIVFSQLVDELTPLKPHRSRGREEVVRGEDGRPLFRIRRQRKVVALCVPVESLSASRFEILKRELAALLEKSREPDADPIPRRGRRERPAALHSVGEPGTDDR